MRSRRSVVLPSAVVGSILFFLFSLAVLINTTVGNILISIEDDLIQGLERDHDIRIEYDSISLASFDTIIMRGLRIRHGDTNRQGILASLASAEVRLRILPLVFGTRGVLDSISSLNIDTPIISIFSDGSLFEKFEKKKNDTNSAHQIRKKNELDVALAIQNGSVRVYSFDSHMPIPAAAPLAELDFSDVKMELKDNKGSFGIQTSFSLLQKQDLADGKMDISGILNLDTGSVDALVTVSDTWIAGLGLPELRFFVSREEGQVTVDSLTFGQPVSIDGRWKEGQSGSFILTLDKNLRSFETFVTRTSAGVLGKMFFKKDEKYKPSGKIALDIGHAGFRMAGAMAIDDSHGRPIFRFNATGNEESLSLERIELSNEEHLISLSGYWDWKGIPDIAARVRAFEIGSARVDANLVLQQVGNGQISVGLEGLRFNGRYAGSVQALVDSSLTAVSVSGFDGALIGRIVKKNTDTVLSLDCKNFQAGSIAGALAGIDLIANWEITGKVEMTSSTNGISLKGDTIVGASDYGTYDCDFIYDGKELKLDRLSSEWFTMSGSARHEYDGASGQFSVKYNGRDWPLIVHVKQAGEMSRVGFEITGMASGQADISTEGVRASFGVQAFDLHPAGIDAILVGDGTIVHRNNNLLSGGKFSLRMKNPEVPSFSLVFQGVGSRFDLTSLVIEHKGNFLSGGGTAWLDEKGAPSLSLAFANGVSVQAQTVPGGYSVVSQFENVDLNTFLPGVISGTLDGTAAIKLENSIPDASWNLVLKKGSFQGIPFHFVTTAERRSGGIQLGNTRIVLGDAEFAVRNGYLTKKIDGVEFLCNGAFTWKGGPFPIESRVLAQGGTIEGRNEVVFALSQFKLGKTRVPDFSSVVTRSEETFYVRKTGPAGIDGWYSPKKNQLDIRYSDNAGMQILLNGSSGKKLDLSGKATGMPLDILENFPKIFRSADGKLDMSLLVKGSLENPDISGQARIADARLDLSMLRTPLTRFSLAASVTQGTITLRGLTATNGNGTLSVRGKAFIRNGEVDDIDVRLQTDRRYGLDLELNDPEIRSTGGVLADLFISGNINAPNVQGRIALHDNEFYYMEDSAIPSKENWIKRIRWNMDVSVLDGVSYVNQLVTAMIQPGSSLQLKNSIIDKDFLVSGRVTASRGTFDYINHEFRIEQPTYIEFKRTSFGLDPWLAFRGRLRIKDEELEDVDIYLTFSGPLSTGINPVFSAEPEKSQDEIRVLLGIEQPDPDTADGRRKNENIMLRSTELISLLGLKPLTKEIREWFGLDIFTIRTPIVRNILERESLDALDPKRQLSIFRDTQFSLGKYLTSFMFVEYTLVLKDDTQNYGDVLPTHQVGLELSFDFLNLGYLIKPTEKSGFDEYEQSIELRFRQRF